MHPSAHIVLSGIEACRRYLRQHPGTPVKAVNRRFDYAETAQQHPASTPQERARQCWVELRPHSAGVAIQLVDGHRRTLAACLLYPATSAPADAQDHGPDPAADCDTTWLGIDPRAITASPFLTALADAATRAIEQLDSSPEPQHG